MRPDDSSSKALALQAEIFRGMGGSRRLEISLEMSEALREMTFARIKQDHPGYTRKETIQAYIREVFGAIRES